MNKDNNLEEFLQSLEDMHNGPGEGQPDEVGVNRANYINQLLQQNFVPTEELLRLYRAYMNGSQESWWCKASLTFREFINTLRMANTKEFRYKKDYRTGFKDGIRFILDAFVD